MSVAFVRPTFFILVRGTARGIFDKIRHNTTKVMLLKRFIYGKMERESGEPDCFNGFKVCLGF